MRQTFMANESNIERKWYVIDAEGQTLGRLSSEVAAILRGKNKVTYTPHVDTGDYVIIINASKIEFTGNEEQDKMYYRHSNHPCSKIKHVKSIEFLDETFLILRHSIVFKKLE